MILYLKITDGGAMYLCAEAVPATNVGDLRTVVTRIDGELGHQIYKRLEEAWHRAN